MNFVFFGTPEFAAVILEKLIEAGFIPRAVVCNPDKPAGRKHLIAPPPAKQIIINRKTQTEVLQPENPKTIRDVLPALHPDFFVVAAYSQILPQEILAIPRLGAVGIHPSLLPKYRGPTPIQAAILNGDEKTGVSLFLIDEKMDHGPILAQSEIKISKAETYQSLHNKLANLGANLLIDFLRKYENARNYEKTKRAPQDETQAVYTKKFSAQNAYIELTGLEKAEREGGEIAVQIDRRIRALNPEPGIWTVKNGKRMKILEAKIIDGKLKIAKIQVEGGKPQIIENEYCGVE